MNIQNLVSAVRQIQSNDKRWIPAEYLGPSYFSINDEWLFETQETENVCPDCEEQNTETFYGSEIRGFFPYLQIEDENTIYPSVHPNCRCRLIRTTFVEKVSE